MKTKTDYITKYNTVTVYHSVQIDRIIQTLGDYFYKKRMNYNAQIRQRRANNGIYTNYGNGTIKYNRGVK